MTVLTVADNETTAPLIKACGGVGRWLYAGYYQNRDEIVLYCDQNGELAYGTKTRRVIDAVSHEMMHYVLRHEVGREASTQYDDLLRQCFDSTYLHKWADGDGQ